jgi:hypothetical protein
VTTNGSAKLEIQVTGRLTSQPKSEEKIEPKLTLNGYLLYKPASGAWERSPPLAKTTLNALDGAATCGDPKKIDKTFTTDALGVAKAGDNTVVECDYHAWVTAEPCEMEPLRAYFSFTKGGKDETPTATAMKYGPKMAPDKKTIVGHVSPVSDQGWQAAAPMWYP